MHAPEMTSSAAPPAEPCSTVRFLKILIAALVLIIAGQTAALIVIASRPAAPTEPLPAAASPLPAGALPPVETSGAASPLPAAPQPTAPQASAPQATAPKPAGPPPAPRRISDVPACSLITHDEAQNITGGPLAEGRQSSASCVYSPTPDGPTLQVELYLGDGAKKQLDIDRDVLGHDFVEVPQVGDEALLKSGHLFVRLGEEWFSLRSVTLGRAPGADDRMIEAAKLIVWRLENEEAS